MTALGESFGRGAMTNHWVDIKNADVILIMGSNAAENHPVAFKWVMEAKSKRNATIISVDPRFTRSSSKADIYAPIRSGTDIAFLGGMINYAISHGKFNERYIKDCTNALILVRTDFETAVPPVIPACSRVGMEQSTNPLPGTISTTRPSAHPGPRQKPLI